MQARDVENHAPQPVPSGLEAGVGPIQVEAERRIEPDRAAPVERQKQLVQGFDYGRQVQAAVERINARYGRAGYRHVQLFYENDYPQAIAGLSIADVVGKGIEERHERPA